MSGEEAIVLDDEIGKVRKACRAIKVVATVLLVVFAIILLLFVGLLAFGMIDPRSSVPFGGLLYAGFLGLDIIAILYCVMKIFAEAEKGRPFERSQVLRLRVISVLLVLFALIELVFGIDFYGGIVIAGYEIGVAGGDVSPTPTSFVNIGALFFAVAIYCVSFIFRYGSLLQEMSDDTV
ncbi:DUF2975 domain-containing protein [Adlercreutzia murintestinalis]|uniref:DUF2975 domain-containing protein n=1 Tax=Adlercreutzia murintestinalis TaxID=2941325 RepID=UPI00203EE0D6|nr:DUF2975 domain-containing protein [Adlercreutzia murintestinalis]